MSQQTLKSFIDLVTFDQKIIQLHHQILTVQSDLAKNHEQQVLAAQRIDLLADRKHEAQKALHAQELIVTDLQDQEQKMAHHLESKSSTKQYDALMKELDTLRQQRNLQEQKMMQLITRLQAFDKEYVTVQTSVQTQITELQQSAHQSTQQLDLLQTEVKQLEAERTAKVVGIPTDWLDVYELMRGRVADPVVPILQDSCSACFYGITPRDLQMIQRNSLIQCKDCYRFLYESTAA